MPERRHYTAVIFLEVTADSREAAYKRVAVAKKAVNRVADVEVEFAAEDLMRVDECEHGVEYSECEHHPQEDR